MQKMNLKQYTLHDEYDLLKYGKVEVVDGGDFTINDSFSGSVRELVEAVFTETLDIVEGTDIERINEHEARWYKGNDERYMLIRVYAEVDGKRCSVMLSDDDITNARVIQ